MERLPLCFRCYTKKPKKKGNFGHPQASNSSKSTVLVLDTETTSEQYQNFIFGSCGVWVNGRLQNFYIFHDDDMPVSKIEKITKSWKDLDCTILPRKEFVETVFFPQVFKARAKCVGFNLGFDLSRLAIDYGKSRKMHNGISLKLSENPVWPRIIVKRLDSKRSFIEFTGTSTKKKSEKYKKLYKGYFVDLKTFCFALTNNSYSLKTAIRDFESPIEKIETEHNGKFDEMYLDYNINDTLATYHLYLKALDRFSNYCLNAEENTLYSPASIGKKYLKKIGLQSFLKKNPDFSKDLLGKIMMTYYGGRTETRIRKEPVKVSYIDFTSMYPSIYGLFNMHKFLVAKNIEFHDSTKDTQELLDNVTREDIARPEFWPQLITICKIIPDEDILPIRAKYGGKDTSNIGVNYLKSTDGTGLWYALPDIIASKFLTGKTPRIQEAISFTPGTPQENLQEIEVLKGLTVRPDEDFIHTIIDRRLEIKNGVNSNYDKKQAKLMAEILKIIANSTSYGIYIQEDVIHHNKKQTVDVNGLDNFTIDVDKTEKDGPFFNPVMGVFLTSGSRLILAAAESLVNENGGYVAYCDTDSVFVSPEHVTLVQKFFEKLNQYSIDVQMFKIEENDKGILLDNVLCYAISAKRYVLFLYDEKNQEFIILKHSAHGLGHIENIDEIQWWKDVLTIHYFPERKNEILSKYKDKPSISSFNVSNYNLLSRFDKINEGKPFSKKIKPFNFFTVGTRYRQDPETGEPIIPCIPKVSKKDYDKVRYMEFIDLRTGKLYPHESSLDTKHYWKTLEAVLEEFIEHKEAKSEDGTGLLKRRHLLVDKSLVKYIGKETNELEISNVLGMIKPIEYNNEQEDLKRIVNQLTEEKAKQIGISRRMYYYLKKKVSNNESIKLKDKTVAKLINFGLSLC